MSALVEGNIDVTTSQHVASETTTQRGHGLQQEALTTTRETSSLVQAGIDVISSQAKASEITPLKKDMNKGTFTLCPFQYQSPCQSPCPCPMKNQFIRKSEVLFRLHQFPYPYPNQCHPISIRSVSIGPPTVKN